MSAVFFTELELPEPHVNLGIANLSHGAMTDRMPEEVNRIHSDRISHHLFCPTPIAVKNLKAEEFPFPMAYGQTQQIRMVGDVMNATS